MDKVRDFKLGARIDRQACKLKNAKVDQKRPSLRHVTYFYIYGTLYFSNTGKLEIWCPDLPPGVLLNM